jgi:hypothetical protein
VSNALGFAADSENMKIERSKILIFFLVITLGINLALLTSSYLLTKENKYLKEDIKILNEERSAIVELIPKLKPTTTKKELLKAIKVSNPGEPVEILEDQVGWRFYHFWFNNDGIIESVTYGS